MFFIILCYSCMQSFNVPCASAVFVCHDLTARQFRFLFILMTSAVSCNSVINFNPFLSLLSLSAHTENLFSESMSHHLLFYKTVAVKQLHVVEAHGILLFRTDKGNCAILYLLSKHHYT